MSKLLAVIAELDDNTRTLMFVRKEFDVQKWAESRRDGFRMLGIVRLVVEEIEISESA